MLISGPNNVNKTISMEVWGKKRKNYSNFFTEYRLKMF